MSFVEYIKPELLILVPVLYIVGAMIKDSQSVSNRYIPAILGGVGIVLSLLYVMGSSGISATGIFTAITQGILIAGTAVYTHEFISQLRKDNEETPHPAAADEEGESNVE